MTTGNESTTTGTPPAAKGFPFLTVLAVVGGVLAGILLLGLLLIQKPKPASTEKTPAEKLAELKSQEDSKLKSYDWIEKPGKGKVETVRIPADRAAELLLQEENKK
jgi:hypothetical protein